MRFRAAVADAETFAHECALTGVIPRPNCTEGGVMLDWLIFILSAVTKEPAELEIIPAYGYSMVPEHNNTIVGLLHWGLADVSLPILTLSADRMKLISYLSPIDPALQYVIYKRVEDDHSPDLEFWHLYPSFILAWCLFLVTLRLFIRAVIASLKVTDEWKDKMEDRSLFTISLFFGILVSLVRSHVTITFNTELPHTEPFQSPDDLLKRLETGEYTALASSKLWLDVLLKPTKIVESNPDHWEMLDRYLEVSEYNEPILVSSMEERINMILNPPPGKKYFTLAGPVLSQLYQYNCNLSFANVMELNHGFDTIGIRPSLKNELRLTSGVATMAIKERERLIARGYQGGKPRCDRIVETVVHNKAKRKTLRQLQGAFWTLVVAYSTAILVVLIENVYFRAKNLLSKKFSGSMGCCGPVLSPVRAFT